MTPVSRKSIRVLLLNSNNELLLMRIEDFDISDLGGRKNKRFWCTVGGRIEAEETMQHAALREIYEETGLAQGDIDLGPVVWYSEVDLMLKGRLTRFEEYYIVAKTINNKKVSLHALTQDEQHVVKELKWFSLDALKTSSEVIFPVLLTRYLPDVLAGVYPKEPINISTD